MEELVQQEPPLILAVTVEEAADALRICRAFMYQLVLKKQVASFKIGRSRRVPVEALHAFIAQKMAADSEAS